ncbi:MAG: hypothetical protein Q9168_005417 [Polycauliona sp. 1 TL-2023]
MLAEAVGPAVTANAIIVRDMFLESTKLHPDHPALVSMYQSAAFPSSDSLSEEEGCLSWTYQQLNDKAEKLASSLYALGLRRGMRIAVFLPNGAEWTLLFWASVKLGTIFVSLDDRAVPHKDEVHHFFDVTKPSAVFVSTAANARILMENTALDWEGISTKVITKPPSTPTVGWQSLADCLIAGPATNGIVLTHQSNMNGHVANHELPEVPATNGHRAEPSNQKDDDLNATVYILFTSGTSGLPKACPLTNKNIWASCMAANGLLQLSCTKRVMINSPSSHSMGLSGITHAWVNGATAVVPTPAFDARMTLEAIDKMECTHMSAIPTMLLALIKQPGFHPTKTRSLELVLLGGTIVPPAIYAIATSPKSLGASTAIAAFGMTEGLPICGSQPGHDLVVHRGAVSLGQALPGVRIRICKSQSTDIVRRGETGELHYSGDMVIGDYLHGDSKSIYNDESGRWIATGDEAMMDDQGNIFIFGRWKDIIIRGGENLSPGLIENCMGRAGVHGQIIGIPDDIAGEVPLAIVHALDHDHIPKAQIHDLVLESLGPTCLPTSYMTLAELGLTSFPLTTSGKVRKTHLRQLLLEKLSSEAAQEPIVDLDGFSVGTSSPLELFLGNAVANLTGLSDQSVPRDQPLSTMLDSINILRLQAQIQRGLSKNIPIDRLLGDTTISVLAMELRGIATTDSPAVRSQQRQGPPTAMDMVHTHDDPRCAARTRAQAETVLSKHNLSWEDVEDVFPFPALSAGSFDGMRPMGFSIRITFMTKSISASHLRSALETTLGQWSMFRSLAMRFDNTPLFIIVKACNAMMRASIIDAPDLESHEDLDNVRFPNPSDNNVHPASGGPLARFAITRLKNTGSTALMMLAHHALYDAISLQAFFRDLQANLSSSPIKELHTNYKLFADTYYLHSHSLPAQQSIAYHLSRLRGIAPLRETLWPEQRCIGAFIGDDTGYSIPASQRNPLLLQERTQIDNDGGTAGMLGIRRSIPLHNLPLLNTHGEISTPIFFKAALALLASRLSSSSSGGREVIFPQPQAGRSWPFLSPSLAAYLPNPVTIAGSTINVVFNRIHIVPGATVADFLSALETEQKELTKHAHAPVASIAAGLCAADASALAVAGKRMLFNWNPVLGDEGSEGFVEPKEGVEKSSSVSLQKGEKENSSSTIS